MTNTCFGAALASMCLAVMAGGQEPAPVVREHAEVNLVNVNVVVVDQSGNPVPGLTAADFVVLDDGKATEVRNAAPGYLPASPSTAADAPAAVQPSSLPPGEAASSIVIFVDCASGRPAQRNAVLELLRPVLHDRMTNRATRVMVARGSLGIQVEQIFTADASLVDKALERVAKEGGAGGLGTVDSSMLTRLIDSGPGGSADFAAADAQSQLLSAQDAAQSAYERTKGYLVRIGAFMDALGGIPGRKIMLWVGDGIQLRPGERLLQQWDAKYGNSSDTSSAAAGISSSRYNLSSEFRTMLHQANASRVQIVAIAASGSSGTSSTADQTVMETDKLLGAASMEKMGMEQSLGALAASTGGEALVGGDVAARTARTLALLGSGYSLGFVDTHGGDGKYHTLKVSVRRPGVSVRHGEGYLEKTPDAKAAEATLSGLYLEKPDNPLELGLAVRSMNKDKGDSYSVVLITVIPLGNAVLEPKGEAHEGKLALWLAARDSSGKVTQSSRQTMPLKILNTKLATALGQNAGFTFSLTLPPGPARAAVTVMDELGQTQSTAALNLVVGEGEPAGAKP